jgi:hypothetical protein
MYVIERGALLMLKMLLYEDIKRIKLYRKNITKTIKKLKSNKKCNIFVAVAGLENRD